MSFVRPSTNTTFLTPYRYGQPLDPTWVNYVDQAFPNILDVSGPNQVTGSIEMKSGSTLQFDSGSTISGTTTSATSTSLTLTNFSSITLANISAIFVNGGSQIQYNGASSGETFFTGTTLTLDNGSVMTVNSGANVLFESGSTLILSDIIDFLNDGNNIGFVHQTTTTTAGAKFTVGAQNTTHAGSLGGILSLQAGTGVSSSLNGVVQIGDSSGAVYAAFANNTSRFYSNAGVSGVGSPLGLLPFQGSANTQVGNEEWIPVFVSTAASGSNALVASILVPNDTMVSVEFKWCRRDLVGGTSSSGWGANWGSFTAIANGSGVITHSAPQQVFSATHYDSISGVTVTTAANNISLYAVAQTDADDWQFLVRVMAC